MDIAFSLFKAFRQGLTSRFRGMESHDQVVTNIFIGNLDFTVTEEQLRSFFAAYGTLETITTVKDRGAGEPRGFAFVEMAQAAEAQAAIA